MNYNFISLTPSYKEYPFVCDFMYDRKYVASLADFLTSISENKTNYREFIRFYFPIRRRYGTFFNWIFPCTLNRSVRICLNSEKAIIKYKDSPLEREVEWTQFDSYYILNNIMFIYNKSENEHVLPICLDSFQIGKSKDFIDFIDGLHIIKQQII